MFKVGDKVVRKIEHQNDCFWPYGSEPLTVRHAKGVDILFEESALWWKTRYFELYVAAPPEPKFKVGDRVSTFNSPYATIVEEVVTVTEFRYKLAGFNDRVRESKLHPSTRPRQIRIDGVNYREVIPDDVSTSSTAEQTKTCKCDNC